ncbi:mitotic-spindle organizing protein 1 [Paragonimus westermani]|uniref:Mitotic-spindle organizing protein 1 n=1 Tax=Paragonimus westermani TaxID=34504 RepID=A0A5J4NFQ7_9TREM|nr:mitotic-spindle organizing protein 1 [Paragonimus westermani]
MSSTRPIPNGGKANEPSVSSSGSDADSSISSAFSTVSEISRLLNTGLDDEELLMCTKLIESGVNPMALAMIVHTAKQSQPSMPTDRR